MSGDGPESDAPTGSTPGEVLAVAGNETRLAILRALYEAPEHRLGYADLMDAVDVRDSGRFNYHLTRLVGPFVRKTDDGYVLGHAGGQVVGAVLAGTYDPAEAVGPVPLEAPCRACEGTLTARYEADFATVACEDCGDVVLRDSVPPGVVEGYEPDAFPEVLARWVRHGFARTVDGFCPVCTGRTDASLGTPEHDARGGVGVELVCRRCGMRFTGAVGSLVLDHPAVVCFHHERGVDLRRVPPWELDWLHAGAELVAEDPARARLGIGLDGDRLTVEVDADGTVLTAERGTPEEETPEEGAPPDRGDGTDGTT